MHLMPIENVELLELNIDIWMTKVLEKEGEYIQVL